MAGATGDVRLTDLLLARGADPAAANQHGWTALHQAAYSNRPDLITRLISAGAPLTAYGRGDGGTPLIVALFWGHREAAELLAGHDIAPGNLRVAAGLGDADLLNALIGSDGCPTTAAVRAPCLLPSARRHAGVAARRGPSGGRGRGPGLGRAQWPDRRADDPRRPRCGPRGRRLPGHRAGLGGGVRTNGRDPGTRRARRRSERPQQLRRPRSRSLADAVAPRRPSGPVGGDRRPARARRGPVGDRRSCTTAPPPDGRRSSVRRDAVALLRDGG